MRIAQVAPLAESVPPKLYGGTERVVSWLTEDLIALGHEVTLFASGDSVTRASLVPVWPGALRLRKPRVDPIVAQTVALEYVAERASEFDVIHFHTDWTHLPLLARLGVPFIGIVTLTGVGGGRGRIGPCRPSYTTATAFRPEIIRHAVWLYLRFTLSYRDVEELLAERGLDISYETVRRWVLKFGPAFARNLRRLRPRPADTWHLDEMVVSIQGRRMYLWRAVDNEGEILDLLVQPRRDKAAALRLH